MILVLILETVTTVSSGLTHDDTEDYLNEQMKGNPTMRGTERTHFSVQVIVFSSEEPDVRMKSADV